MNLISLAIVFCFGLFLWWRSGIIPTRRYFFVALGIVMVLWWGIWGQVAVSDHWWVYNEHNISGGFLGVVPVADMLYFFGVFGWYLYIFRKLDLL